MIRLEFLLQERLMEKTLKNILPLILTLEYPYNSNHFLPPHQWTADLPKAGLIKMKSTLYYTKQYSILLPPKAGYSDLPSNHHPHIAGIMKNARGMTGQHE